MARFHSSIPGTYSIIEFNPEYSEYCVQFFQEYNHLENADYFTNDRTDAICTMRHELHNMTKPQD